MNKKTLVVGAVASIMIFGTVLVVIVLPRLGANSTDLAIQASDNATNAPFDMYIRVVDENGQPLEGVACSYTLGRFATNWALMGKGAKRGADVDLTGITGPDGRLHIHDFGHSLVFYRFVLNGYSRLYDKDSSNEAASQGKNSGFYFRLRGQTEYVSEASHPAIFVMVKDGVKTVTTLPSAGGSQREEHIGGPRRPLLPVWPKEPSIRGVRYVPTTHPAIL